jgi:hypothetical protein
VCDCLLAIVGLPEYCPREGVSSLPLRIWTARLETCDTARVFGSLICDLAGALHTHQHAVIKLSLTLVAGALAA